MANASPADIAALYAALHLACAAGDKEGMILALSLGADPETRFEGGFTPLGVIACNRHADCVHALLPFCDPKTRMDLDSHSPQGVTALMISAEAEDPSTLLALLPRSDPLAVDSYGESALHWAAGTGSRACAAALLPLSDPLARNAHGYTPLMIAIGRGLLPCVLEIAPHSDLEALDFSGNSVLDLAQQRADDPNPALEGDYAQTLGALRALVESRRLGASTNPAMASARKPGL